MLALSLILNYDAKFIFDQITRIDNIYLNQPPSQYLSKLYSGKKLIRTQLASLFVDIEHNQRSENDANFRWNGCSDKIDVLLIQ